METATNTKDSRYRISFHGSKMHYLGLSLYNLLLTVLTLGLYYPWAKCAIRKFILQETEIAGSRFEWHGTGGEMFRGFIKAYAVLGILLIIINFGPLIFPAEILIWVVLTAYFIIIALIPLAIHGMMRYRLSRTTLRGIHFGYRGELSVFYKRVGLDFLLTIVTFGIYGYWMTTNLRKYVMQHSRYGNVEGDFEGDGGNLFLLSFMNGLAIVFTLYIYLPWAIISFFRFYVENTVIIQDGKKYHLKTDAKGGQYFIVLIKAFLITVFTLGILGPIADLMIFKYLSESVSISSEFDFDSIQQTEKDYKDATGEDMADILDIDF